MRKTNPHFVKKSFFFTALLLLSFLIASCSAYGFFWGQFGESDVDERSPSLVDFGTLNLSEQKIPFSSIYSVIVVTDLHFGSEREELDEEVFLSWLDSHFKKYSEGETKDYSKIPRFVINLGDTADGGKKEQFEEFVVFENKIKTVAGKYLYGENDSTPDSKRKFKVWSILGNHDLYHGGSVHFEKLVFPYTSSYFFNFDAGKTDSYPGFSFYFLDTANGTLGPKQLEDFKKRINDDSRPKIVCTHYPVYAGGSDMFMIIQDSVERNTLLTYFAKNNVRQVYEGHAHKDYGFDFEKFREDVIGSLRFSMRTNKQCALVTVNEETVKVFTEIIEF